MAISWSMGLAAVSETRRLDSDDLQYAAELVDHEGGQGLSLDVFGNDHERLAGLDNLLQHGKEVLHVVDLAVVDQDVGVFEDGFHPLCVGDHVGADVALVKLEPFYGFKGRADGLAVFDGDNAIFADLLHRFRDEVADNLVVG
jgi:hypothetical protein